ncbi:MAG: GspH/FimT family pseudopilin [Candidatus Thiodiazotropha sp.]
MHPVNTPWRVLIMQPTVNKAYPGAQGFSLLELLVTLLIFSILITIVIPSYRSFVAKNLQASEINSVVQHFRLARSLSIARETHHVVCPSGDGESCSPSSDWSQGFILYEDSNRNRARDGSEVMHGVHQPGQDVDIDIHASQGRSAVVYQGDGRPSGYNLTLTFCDPGNQVPPRAVIVNNVGRVRISETRWNGEPLNCSG